MIQPRYVEKSAAIGVEKPRNEFLGKNHLKTHHQESDHRLVMAVHIQNPGGSVVSYRISRDFENQPRLAQDM